ncbi:LacI family DNA-binding transcriptional regulator [Microbacterium jejuense]|uniref:LacI family DNA-binding transcriptional regulator n=1 Tax=Microbacterium jejuense TaxID=1263637 RepID=A0ABS7HTS6_9MICO|nr:LacI family DNA-binding transcriptional regulator [Microbacterium jejuense]MBW9095303.1 LacI family DNA-binding transcriptional regulator [Microbacterium jejuense]
MTDARPHIGLMFPATGPESLAPWGHDGEYLAALDDEVRRRGMRLVLCGTRRAADIPDIADDLHGVVLMGYHDNELDALPQLGARAVAVDGYSERDDLMIVRSDDHEGGRRAGELLTSRGHRELVLVGPDAHDNGAMRARAAGFERAARAAGVSTIHRHVSTGTSLREGTLIGRMLPTRHPSATAVFATTDTLAAGVVEGLGQAGARVPDDVSVVGYDNLALASLVTPKLSTVAQNVARKARLTIDLLVDPDHSGPLVTEVVVLERATVAPPAPHR